MSDWYPVRYHRGFMYPIVIFLLQFIFGVTLCNVLIVNVKSWFRPSGDSLVMFCPFCMRLVTDKAEYSLTHYNVSHVGYSDSYFWRLRIDEKTVVFDDVSSWRAMGRKPDDLTLNIIIRHYFYMGTCLSQPRESWIYFCILESSVRVLASVSCFWCIIYHIMK